MLNLAANPHYVLNAIVNVIHRLSSPRAIAPLGPGQRRRRGPGGATELLPRFNRIVMS